MTLDKKQALLGPLTEFTVYSGELIGLELALKIVEDHPEIDRPITIFTDNQASIAAVKIPKQQSCQFVLERLATMIQTLNKNIHIHWIPVHVGVPGNEAADIAAKEATRWREKGRGPQAALANNLKVLTSAMQSEIRTRAKEAWDEA